MDIKGHRIAVLGGGTSGLASARLAASCGAVVMAFDSGEPSRLTPAVNRFAEYGIELVVGERALRHNQAFDLVVTSPGISAEWEIATCFTSKGVPLIGEIELAWQLRSDDAPVIGITGTNGKTTTTDLVSAILNGAGKKTVPCGNYGLAYSEVVRCSEQLDVHTVELSSFQLETIDQFRPEVAVWMNFAPDHMDRYQSLDEYRTAKERIFLNQTEGDLALLKWEDSGGLTTGARQTFSAFSSEADFRYRDGWIVGPGAEKIVCFRDCQLFGLHNAENVMAAMAAAQAVGVSFSSMQSSVMEYRAPEHRCEFAGRKQGITFINDSKSTNLHSLESSLRGQEDAVILIAGGKEKGLDFSEIQKSVVEKVKFAVVIGEMGESLQDLWGDSIDCQLAGSLEEAVKIAAAKGSDGDVVLFSPGTSSFDMFSSYEERGRCFKAAVDNVAV